MDGHILLSHALAVREGRVLLVASRYADRAAPLWNLPGGRQERGELLVETALRELREETGLSGRIRELAYLSESYDPEGTHFLASIFAVDVDGGDARRGEDRIVDLAWIAPHELEGYVTIPIVRDPLAAYLRGVHPERYRGVHDAGTIVRWP
jgi:8-oxo-dGTP diphosphatase